MILAQIGASSLIPVVIARIVREADVARRWEWVTALPALVPPGLVVYAVHKRHPLPFGALLLSLTVLSVMRLASASSLGSHVRAGLVLGLATRSRATVAMFALPTAVWLVAVAPDRGRRRAALGIAPFLGRALPPSSWTGARSSPEPTKSSVGRSTRGTSWARLTCSGRRPARSCGSTRGSSRARGPEMGVVLVVSSQRGPSLPRLMVGPRPGVFYAALLTGAVLGVVAAWSRADRGGRQRLVLLLLMLGGISAAQSLFYVDVRHRWGVEPLLGIFLAFAAGWWREPPREREGRALDGPAAIA